MHFKISIVSLIAFLFVSINFAHSQTSSNQEEYTAHNPGWLVELEAAMEESATTGKPIMANFTGSDWCGWCIRLTKSVFETEEFKTWAEDNVVLLELDFPKRSQLPKEIEKQNYKMKNAFKITGYPTVWVFDMEEGEDEKYMITPYGKTGYKKTPEEFISDVERMLENRA